MSSSSLAVKKYFENSYPVRGSWKSRFFRPRDVERLNILSDWLPSLMGKSLCDIGCGDGTQIRRILSHGNMPSNLLLQDISRSAIHRAKENLAGCGCSLSELVGDAFTDGFGGPHDIVIAIGVTDYYRNWDDILDVLLKGTSELLIVDFPRKWKLRNLPRRLWLWRNHMDFNAISYQDLCALLSRHTGVYEIEKSTYNWFVRINKANSA